MVNLPDKFWVEAQQALKKSYSGKNYIIAPREFSSFFEKIYPYEKVKSIKPKKVSFYLIDKGRLKEFPREHHLQMQKGTILWANEVFVLVTTLRNKKPENFKPIHKIVFETSLKNNLKTNNSPARRRRLEQLSRDHSNYGYIGEDEILCKILNKYFMYVPSYCTSITPHLIMDGFWESWVTLFIQDHVSKGDVVLDIGANTGYFTLLMADLVGETGKVLSIEPVKSNHRYLRKSLMANRFEKRVEIVPFAASSSVNRTVSLKVPKHRPSDASYINPCEEYREVDCLTTTVDQITKNFDTVNFIKIDAEGAEPDILEGMSWTLSKNPKIKIILEFTPSAYSNPEKFLISLHSKRFKVHYINEYGSPEKVPFDQILNDIGSFDWKMLYIRR